MKKSKVLEFIKREKVSLISAFLAAVLLALIIIIAYSTQAHAATIPTPEPNLACQCEISEINVPVGAVAFETVPSVIYLPLPEGSTGAFKSIERYWKINKKDSAQYALQQKAFTDAEGFRRIDDYYLVAMGQFYSNTIGQTFIVELESRTIKVMIGDVKRDEDCIDRMYDKKDKSILEFIVDEKKITRDQLNEIMSGKILSIVEVG